MNDSELSHFTLYYEKSGPGLSSLRKLLRRAASFFTRKDIEEIIPVFREGGRLEQNRGKR